jgi:hypothetical protein
MKKKINKVSLIVDINGYGLVNYNGSEVPNRFYAQMKDASGRPNKNGTFGKENIYTQIITDGDGNTKEIKIPKKIISSNLLRKEILGDENSVNADKLITNDKLRVAFLSQDNVIARGFMCAGRNDTTLKRKGGLTVLDAEQTSNTITWLETRTKEGDRDSTSLHFKETCGDIEYQSEIFFDIKQLQFISIDDNYDRMSLTEKDVNGFINHIDSRYGEGNATFGNWGTTHLNVIGEQGIVLSNKVVGNIIRETIKRILTIDIKRANAFAKTSSVKVALGYEGDDINLLSSPTYKTINSIEEYDALIGDTEIGIDFLHIDAPRIEKMEKIDKKDK